MGNPLVAIVTGANRGIGEAICQTLSRTFQKPLVLYATSRKGTDLGLKPSSSTIEIKYPQLDIADAASIQNLADTVESDHLGIDVLINNAGVNLDDAYSPINIKKTLDTNYRGTLKMCQIFIPLMKEDGRIVNISSVASGLSQYSEDIRQRFRNSNMRLEDLDDLVKEYQETADNSNEDIKGWPKQAYSVSKACINALTAVLARDNAGLLINSCCPGWVSTDMGKMVGSAPPKRPAEGAKIPIRLGFKDIDGVTGKYWGNRSISGIGEGQVLRW